MARTFRVPARRLLVASLILALIAIAGTLVAFSPLALNGFNGMARNWNQLSLIGQTYGAASALLSVIALIGVATSLVVQTRENKANREQALRTSHGDFMRLAMSDPLYAQIWLPLNPPGDFDVQRQHMYVNVVVSHWEMEYGLGALTEEHLRTIARGVFSTDAGRRYWQYARPTQLVASIGRRERKFRQILDEEYAATVPVAVPAVPVASGTRPQQRRASSGAVITAMTGAVAALIVVRRLARGRSARAGQSKRLADSRPGYG
jgi:hypothetical protein